MGVRMNLIGFTARRILNTALFRTILFCLVTAVMTMGGCGGGGGGGGGGTDSPPENSNQTPAAAFSASTYAGESPLTVNFNASSSSDPDGSISAYSWNFGDSTGGSGVSVSHTFGTSGTYTVVLTVTDNLGATHSATETIVVSSPVVSGLPPDPATVAPALNPAEAAQIGDSSAFLYAGSPPIQTGVNPLDIDPLHMAVIRGTVKDRSGAALPGVTITILGHPEYGQTLSRSDGMFDLAVNGGGYLSVSYQKENYLSIMRPLEVPWREFAWLPDVVMTPLDGVATVIDFSKPIEVARGATTSDDRGERTSTLLFPGGTTVQMELSDGSTQPLASLTVRSTEYTIGGSGPQAMPGPLPYGVGYTYAVELSIDEAIAAGAETVHFSQPVIHYVENFIGFPVGEPVPSYYFDRKLGSWLSMQPGVVIKILNENGSIAEIDADGDGLAEDSAAREALGITMVELQQLALLYDPDQTLWRVPLEHFSPVDLNFDTEFPEDAIVPDPPNPSAMDVAEESCEEAGSIVECQGQVLGERIPVAGTPYSFNYRSDRMPGHGNAYIVDIPLRGSIMPGSVREIQLEISVAGRLYTEVLTDQFLWHAPYRFIWDGLDAYGREIKGKQPIRVRIGYSYPVVYRCTSAGCTVDPSAGMETLWHTWKGWIGQYAFSQGLGGWSISPHHTYDPAEGVLQMGSGRRVRAMDLAYEIGLFGGAGELTPADGVPLNQAKLEDDNTIAVGPDNALFLSSGNKIYRVGNDGILTTIAGTGQACQPYWDETACGENIPASEARINSPTDLKIGPDGSLYFSDSTSHQVRKVTPDGIITTVAGNGYIRDSGGAGGFSGDGGLAVNAALNSPGRIAFDPEGSLYIVDNSNFRVRKVDPDGIITTVMGSGNKYSDECLVGVPATDSWVIVTRSGYSSIAVDQEGLLVVADRLNNCIRRIEADGILSRVAGTSLAGGYSGDGGPADEAEMKSPVIDVVGPDGSIYVFDNSRIRRIGPDGIITTIAGNGLYGFGGDNGPALKASLGGLNHMAMGPDQSLLFSGNNRIRRIKPSTISKFAGQGAMVVSQNGSEVFFFDAKGRHLSTVHALTGAVAHLFTYDDNGLLAAIEDGSGNQTLIERSADQPAAIAGPYGHRTTLTTDNAGYLAAITNPVGDTWTFTYEDGGMLTLASDPSVNESIYTYSDEGRLIATQDPGGGGQTLARTPLVEKSGYQVVRGTAEGVTTTYTVEQLEGGGTHLTSTSSCCAGSDIVVVPDGTRTRTAPDGTVTRTVSVPDPRFGRDVSIPRSMITTTPDGLTQTIQFDRSVSLEDPDDPLSLKQQSEEVTINGRTYTRTFNAETGQEVVTTPEGRQTTTLMDSQGRVTSSQVAGLVPTTYQYDSQGRLSRVALGSREYTMAYGSDGFLSALTDPLNRITGYTYDDAGRLNQKTAPDLEVTGYTWQAHTGLTSLAPPDRASHDFAYNSVGLLAEYQPPPVSTAMDTLYTYDLDRRATQIDRPDGTLVSFSYDTGGRLASVATPDGNITLAYDSAGRLASLTRGGQSLAFTFDGFLMTRAAWSGDASGSVNWTYNNDFRIVSQTVNQESSIAFSYDDDGLVVQAGDLSLTRDSQTGMVTATSLGSTGTRVTYNGFGEVDTFTAVYSATPLLDTIYLRDDLGRIISKTETIGGVTADYDYTYDTAGRLLSVATDSVVTESYTYGANGNRTNDSGATASYDGQDRLIQYGDVTYTYTDAGDLWSKTDTVAAETTSYSYDALGNLLQVDLPDGTMVSYGVDGMNRRTAKYIDNVMVQGFLYQDELNPVAELNGAGAIRARFVYGSRPNVPDYMIMGGGVYRIFSDHLGSPRLVVNTADGTVSQRLDYNAFGRVLVDTSPGFQPFGFAGGLYDPDTGLVRFGSRDYDPQTGRWTAKDPIRFAGGDTNLYAYVANDPVNLIDPTGLACTNQALMDNYLQGLRDILSLRQERERLGFYIRNRTTHVYDRRDSNWGTFWNVLAQIGQMISQGEPYGGNVSIANEFTSQGEDEMTENSRNIIAAYERRIAEIDIELLAIEQMLDLARQNCPCLYQTNFP